MRGEEGVLKPDGNSGGHRCNGKSRRDRRAEEER